MEFVRNITFNSFIRKQLLKYNFFVINVLLSWIGNGQGTLLAEPTAVVAEMFKKCDYARGHAEKIGLSHKWSDDLVNIIK